MPLASQLLLTSPGWPMHAMSTYALGRMLASLSTLHTERHNEAVACVSKAVMEGGRGRCFTALMVDAGWHGKVTGIASCTRIPQQAPTGVPDAVLKRMRPDLLLFERLAGAGPLNLDSLEQASERSRCKVHIVEVGSCMETAYMTKQQDRYAQHQQLIIAGGQVTQKSSYICSFWTAQVMFHLTAQHLKQLGIIGPPLLEYLHPRALKRLEQLVGTRRRHEHDK